LFARLAVDVETGNPQEIAAALAKSPLRYVLAAALDHWAEHTPLVSPLLPRLLLVARLVDPDPWRDRVRQCATMGHEPERRLLAAKAQTQRHGPHVLLLLASGLPDGDAVQLLRRALVDHPHDLVLYFHLGHRLKVPAERIGCYQAAVALRPDSAPACNNLGVA